MRLNRWPEAQQRKRAAAYRLAFGRYRAKWLLWREAMGDRRCVASHREGGGLSLRLNTTDILVWASVFQREEYGASLPFEPRVIVDAGAYTGLSSVYFARKYPQARVLALEPDASNFELLKQNSAPFANIVPLNNALWYEEGSVELYDRNRGHWAFSVCPPTSETHSGGQRVGALTIPALMAIAQTDVIDILKIDVEGAEREIFEHSAEWIGRVGAIFAELHDRLRPGCTAAFEVATVSFSHQATSPLTVLSINERLVTTSAQPSTQAAYRGRPPDGPGCSQPATAAPAEAP